MRLVTTLALLLACTCALMTTASAQHDEAERLLEEGVAARRAGDDARARDLFRQAIDARPTPRASAQLGLAEQALGNWAEAHRYVSEAVAVQGDAWIDERRSVLETALTTIEQHVGRVEINGLQAGASVLVDGEEVATAPLQGPLVLAQGTHTIEARLAGYYPVSRPVDVQPGELSRINAPMRVRAGTDPSDAANAGDAAPGRPAVIIAGNQGGDRPVERDNTLLYAGIGLVAAGGLTMVGGLVTHGLREGAASDWNDDSQCLLPSGATREETCGDKRETAETMGTISPILYGLGAAMVASGAVLIVLNQDDEDAAPQAGSVRCAPGFVSGSCTVTF